MHKTKISIIVPIYNSENDLGQCIESIANQTYKNIEIILVNDGSTDGSLEICEKWERKDSRIVVIDKPNSGLASARNAGLEESTGDLIGFVDHDDYIEPEMYEEMYNDMVDHNADIVMCSSYGVDSKGNKTKAYSSYNSFEIETKELVKRMLHYEKIFCSSVWSKLYKRSIIGGTRFVDEIVLGEDYYFNGRVYSKINRFYYDSRAFYNYRIVDGSMSRNKVNKYFFDKYKVVEKLEEYYSDCNYVTEDDFTEMRLSVSYELLYRLYEYDGTRNQKKEWKEIFKNNAKKYKTKTFKDYIKILFMKHITWIYVKITLLLQGER